MSLDEIENALSELARFTIPIEAKTKVDSVLTALQQFRKNHVVIAKGDVPEGVQKYLSDEIDRAIERAQLIAKQMGGE